MKKIIDALLGRTRVLVMETEYAVTFYKGEIQTILGAGEHVLPNRDGSLRVNRFDAGIGIFTSPYEKTIFDKLPDLADKYLKVFRTDDNEIVILERDNAIFTVLGPNKKLIVWKDVGPWKETRIEVGDNMRVDPKLVLRLTQVRKTDLFTAHQVQEGQVGLLFHNGILIETLHAGTYAFWNIRNALQVKILDLKRQSLDVQGQEVLTRDRVTIRVNLAAEYRVVDPVKAVATVKDYQESLYRALQYAFRKTLGVLTLDQILETKVNVNQEAAEKVRRDMEAIGLEVTEIALKDVILPGEMRDILNQVVTAEKQAEANVIRRREETNATRSLLNTAKVMAENPVMLRLKELEVLETIADKVKNLTIHNGTNGLMNDLVKLRE